MTRTNFRKGFLPAAVLGAALLFAGGGAGAEEGCDAAQCHAKLLARKNVHAAAGSCESCHQSTGGSHPQKGGKTFALTQQPPELCGNCHEAFGKKSQGHAPAREGMCLSCHDPHSSEQSKLLLQPQKDLCESCHASHSDAKVLHGPVSAGDCTACHGPHETDVKPLLLKPVPGLCFGCHVDLEEVLKKKNVHPALDAGCTSCHNPHGGAYRRMLSEEGSKLCFTCHAEIADKVQKSPVMHPPIFDEKGCASCHSPHASDYPRMLPGDEKTLCLGCHNEVLKKNMTTFHGPINKGKCTACHDPHGNQSPKLLDLPFPSDPYVPYTDQEYSFCFSCHNRDLLQYPETSFATNFRDGEKNLHFVHVNNKQKGRNCRLCHNIHGSPNPKLIAESAPFGKWNMPLKYVKSETGGGCSPGCHKTLYYDRKNPGRKPEATKSEKG